jgi:hypothetical protein
MRVLEIKALLARSLACISLYRMLPKPEEATVPLLAQGAAHLACMRATLMFLIASIRRRFLSEAADMLPSLCNNKQHGFSKGKSIHIAISEFTKRVYKAQDEKESNIGIWLDL